MEESYSTSKTNVIALQKSYIFEIIRITGTRSFCVVWVGAITQCTLK
jgi:hypothetical protein